MTTEFARDIELTYKRRVRTGMVTIQSRTRKELSNQWFYSAVNNTSSQEIIHIDKNINVMFVNITSVFLFNFINKTHINNITNITNNNKFIWIRPPARGAPV